MTIFCYPQSGWLACPFSFKPVSTRTSRVFIDIRKPKRTHSQSPDFMLLSICNNMREVEEKEEKIPVEVSPLAYKKMVYHLLRYPTSKVTGVFTGEKQYHLANAYPLFHSPIVNPTFSLALDLVESNLPQGHKVIGFYELVQGNEFKVGSMVENNANMGGMVSMRVWVDNEKLIRLGSAKFNFSAPEFNSLEEGLKKGEYRFIVDMDAHLQEVELDFRNDYLE